MVVYSNPDGTYPRARDMGLRDFYHDENGNYVGNPIFIPLEYKGRENEYYADLNRSAYGEDYVCNPPKYDEKQSYHLEKETANENLSWGRNHYAERCNENKQYEAWLNNWN